MLLCFSFLAFFLMTGFFFVFPIPLFYSYFYFLFHVFSGIYTLNFFLGTTFETIPCTYNLQSLKLSNILFYPLLNNSRNLEHFNIDLPLFNYKLLFNVMNPKLYYPLKEPTLSFCRFLKITYGFSFFLFFSYCYLYYFHHIRGFNLLLFS